jgi:hypothetical protein
MGGEDVDHRHKAGDDARRAPHLHEAVIPDGVSRAGIACRMRRGFFPPPCGEGSRVGVEKSERFVASSDRKGRYKRPLSRVGEGHG